MIVLEIYVTYFNGNVMQKNKKFNIFKRILLYTFLIIIFIQTFKNIKFIIESKKMVTSIKKLEEIYPLSSSSLVHKDLLHMYEFLSKSNKKIFFLNDSNQNHFTIGYHLAPLIIYPFNEIQDDSFYIIIKNSQEFSKIQDVPMRLAYETVYFKVWEK